MLSILVSDVWSQAIHLPQLPQQLRLQATWSYASYCPGIYLLVSQWQPRVGSTMKLWPQVREWVWQWCHVLLSHIPAHRLQISHKDPHRVKRDLPS